MRRHGASGLYSTKLKVWAVKRRARSFCCIDPKPKNTGKLQGQQIPDSQGEDMQHSHEKSCSKETAGILGSSEWACCPWKNSSRGILTSKFKIIIIMLIDSAARSSGCLHRSSLWDWGVFSLDLVGSQTKVKLKHSEVSMGCLEEALKPRSWLGQKQV